MSTPALDRLVENLVGAFEAGRADRGERVTELLAAYGREHEDWRACALFDQECYTRNLIHREERFELLLLCWGAGQESPIHNHEGQDCWMGVLDGKIEEARYCRPPEVRPGPLDPLGARRFDPGQVAYISDEIGLHVVRPLGGAPACSLHLYAAPYRACNVYCPETGKVTRRELSDYSVRGRRPEPEAL